MTPDESQSVSGLGDVEKAQMTQIAGAAATSALSSAASAGLISAGVAGPIGAAIGGAVLGLSMLFGRKGPAQKTKSSKNANEIEKILAQNQDWWSAVPHTQENKDYALSVFDYYWNQAVALWGDPSMGEPGQRAITERSRGGKWDWFAMHRDPIANTPTIADTEGTGAEVVANLESTFGNSFFYLAVGALVLGIVISSGKD